MTKQQLPPEDQPSRLGLIPGSEQGAFADIDAHNAPSGPWAVGHAFFLALIRADGPDIGELRHLATPESLDVWGDFGAAREVLLDCGMLSRTESPAPGVAYVRFVSDPGENLVATSDMVIMARAVATIQYRPESGRWLVHALGNYVRPEELPPVAVDG